MTHPTIHMGSKGSEVKLAQQALKDRGYDPGPIDGIFGPKTRKAVLVLPNGSHYRSDAASLVAAAAP